MRHAVYFMTSSLLLPVCRYCFICYVYNSAVEIEYTVGHIPSAMLSYVMKTKHVVNYYLRCYSPCTETACMYTWALTHRNRLLPCTPQLGGVKQRRDGKTSLHITHTAVARLPGVT